MSIENMEEMLLSALSIIDDNVLLYKHPPNLTSHYYKQVFLVANTMIQKHGCQYVICDTQTVARDFVNIQAGVKDYLPKMASLIECLAFVISEQKIWEEVKLVLEKTEINLDCKVIVVRSQEEALNIFEDLSITN